MLPRHRLFANTKCVSKSAFALDGPSSCFDPCLARPPSIAPVLRWFADKARKHRYFWSFRKREVSLALYLGFVIAFLPIVGIQFILAFASAWVLRANLPVMMGTQLVTNLATMWAIYPALALFG